jgi:diaminohydroxyphosphoribosylaminopyrimidine deaminase/5-amino-6-(5-phosphoribosylamino)uracil reductase
VESAAETPTLVLCSVDAPASAEEALVTRGVEVLRAPSSAEGRIDALSALRALAARGIVTLMVEGGAELAGSMLAGRFCDELHAFIAPSLLGPRGRRPARWTGRGRTRPPRRRASPTPSGSWSARTPTCTGSWRSRSAEPAALARSAIRH